MHNLTPEQIAELQELKNKLENGHVIVDGEQLKKTVRERNALLSVLAKIIPLVKPFLGGQVNIMAAMPQIMNLLQSPEVKEGLATDFQNVIKEFPELTQN